MKDLSKTDVSKITAEGEVFLVNCGESCEMSASNLGRVLEFLKLNNFVISQNIAGSDYVLVNSCCVIEGKRELVRQNLQAALKLDNIKKIILFGCLAGIDGLDSNKIIRISSKNIEKIDDYFEWKVSIKDIFVNSYSQDFFIPYQKSCDPNVRYILISQGCENRCSYCNIKNAKGSTKSRQVSQILREIETNLKKNYFEFILLADDCGSYGADIDTNVVRLISDIFELDQRIKLRVHYLFPTILIKFHKDFEEFIKTGRITYMNIPIQSGSQRILNLMNRQYDINKVLEIAGRLKSLSPATWFYTHIIVNFPTETDEDFIESLKASDNFDELLFMNYSTNPLTSASKYPEVEEKQQERRLNIVKEFLNITKKGLLIDSKSLQIKRSI